MVRFLFTSIFLLPSLTLIAQRTTSQREEWNRPAAPLHIIGNIYYVGAEGVSSFLITTPQGSILLDGGLPETGPLILKNIATLGFQIKDVKYLLSSHAHYDHMGSFAELKKRSGAQLVVSRADAPVIESGKHDLFDGKPVFFVLPVKVDRVIDNGATVQLGGTVLTAHITPGHTKGCTNWTMPVTEGAQTHQVIFFCSTSVPGYQLIGNKEYPNIVADYRSSFAKLRQINADVFLAPHPSFFDLDGKRARVGKGQPNPFVDPQEFHAHVEKSAQAFEEELKKQQSRQGK